MRIRTRGLVAAGVLVVAAGPLVAATGAASAGDQPLPQAVTHEHFNGYEPLVSDGDGTAGAAAYRNPSSPICSVTNSSDDNALTDCEGTAPHNETTIAVNPTDSSNMIGGANDYQLATSSGGTVNETAFARAHVTSDGGRTWAMYPIAYNGYASAGDPALAFDADGRAYYATIAFIWSQGGPLGTNPDVLVATSPPAAKGTSWTAPVRVAAGSGSWTSAGVFNDKEEIAAWGHGNAIVTWTVFNQGPHGAYLNSPIYDSVTHDGGATWTAPVEISGSAPFCVGASGGTACDQDQGSVPAVAADGSIYVSFVSTADTTDYRDQYLVVKVDAATGQPAASPSKVAEVYDGLSDYPGNVDGRQTYQDSQFRTWSVGAIAADPTNASHLAVVWSDMRNSTLPANPDPYQATTDSDIIVSQSTDGGATWSAPTALKLAGDQFMPWPAFDTSGQLRIGFFDRSYDPANHKYGYTLATQKAGGKVAFNYHEVTTALSDPTRGDRWFSGRTPNPGYPHPTTFLGDYSGITTLPGGGVATLWTDLRNEVSFQGRTGTGEDAYFAPAS